MSSKNFAPTISEHGIFDNDESKSNLWGYNKVYIAYCSSDGWIGDAPASGMYGYLVYHKIQKSHYYSHDCFIMYCLSV